MATKGQSRSTPLVSVGGEFNMKMEQLDVWPIRHVFFLERCMSCMYLYINIYTFLCTWESFGTVTMRVFVGAGRNLIVSKLQWHHGHAFRTSKHSRLDNGHFDAILKMSIVYGLWYLFPNVFSLRLAHEASTSHPLGIATVDDWHNQHM